MYRERSKQKLSVASLETLAIISYKQPITRMEIESIRGVNIDGVMHHLTDLGLIKIEGRKEVPGRPFLYITTRKFLEYFGLNSLKDLPKIEDFVSMAQKEGLNVPADPVYPQAAFPDEKNNEMSGIDKPNEVANEEANS
jgi:segregation and condensation protein B